jgi:pimeloyl-ACP methyl ester carboxylesterase
MIESRPTIEAADGHSVAAIHLKTGAESLVILSHGITSEKNEDGIYSRLAETKLAAHFDSIRFDFRGHGESALSSRESTISGEILDLMAVFGWARRQQYRRVFHLATSFGGSITLLAAQCFDLSFLSAVAFWSPVIDYDRTFIHSETPWAREFFDQATVDELAYRVGTPVPETAFVIGPVMTTEMLLMRPQATEWPSRIPLLIVHGDADSAVPLGPAREFVQRNSGARLHVVPGVDHGYDNALEAVFELTTTWFVQHL